MAKILYSSYYQSTQEGRWFTAYTNGKKNPGRNLIFVAVVSSFMKNIIYPSQRLNMENLHDNANASLPALKQTPLIHAASISLFAYYRHPSQFIYKMITASTRENFNAT